MHTSPNDVTLNNQNSPFGKRKTAKGSIFLLLQLNRGGFLRKSACVIKPGSVVDWLFIVTPIVGDCICSMFCCTLLYAHSSFAIILMGKIELVTLLSLSSWCLVFVVWLFLAVPWVCLQVVIVVFPDHTYTYTVFNIFNLNQVIDE